MQKTKANNVDSVLKSKQGATVNAKFAKKSNSVTEKKKSENV